MKNIFLLTCFCISLSLTVPAQVPLSRPKLVVGLVLDQMRWDFLYRYYDRYQSDGIFKKMLTHGFSCENTSINYTPAVTASGHSAIYSGAVPAVSGITGNYWWDRRQMKTVYCTEDPTVSPVGTVAKNGKQSPRNMQVTTICDELRLATNFKSKVIGVAIKDRGGILAAGHSANAAYWYDHTTGNWITSTYYMNFLPAWVNDFNAAKKADSMYQKGWQLLYDPGTYLQSTAIEKGKPVTTLGKGFPYDLSAFQGKDYAKISMTPMGNSLTTAFAKAAILNETLGKDEHTDFLTISYSSPDYIGHTFGPNSAEAEDDMLRLDKELGELLNFLDRQVGKNQYTVFLTTDHGVAHVPEFLTDHKIPAGRVFIADVTKRLNLMLLEKFSVQNSVFSDENYQVHFNHMALDSAGVHKSEIYRRTIDFLLSEPGIDKAFAMEDLNSVPLPGHIREMMNNGYHKERNGDIQILLKPGYIDASGSTGTTHGLWNPYDTHIPLLWYGRGIEKGKLYRETHIVDIAPTLAALLKIQAPNGCTGKAITELIQQEK